MAEIMIIASGKGGVGKSTITANCGMHLAKKGYRVLLVDGDCGLRSLDILLGLSSKIVYDFSDLVASRSTFEESIIRSDRNPNLYLLPAAVLQEDISFEQTNRVLKKLRAAFNLILIDASAGIGEMVQTFAKCADRGIVVATPDSVSIRGAATAGGLLGVCGVKDLRLVINRVRPELIRRGLALDLDSVIDGTEIQLIGIVPEDKAVLAAAGKENTIAKNHSKAYIAYSNIARRIAGEYVPLMRL